MSKHKTSSNNLFTLVFGAVVLFAIGTAVVVVTTIFYQNPTSIESKASEPSTSTLQIRDSSNRLTSTRQYNSTPTSTGFLPQAQATTPVINSPKGTFSVPTKAVQIDFNTFGLDRTGEIVKTMTLQTASSADFRTDSIILNQVIDFARPNWQQYKLYGASQAFDFSLEPNKTVYLRLRIDEFTDVWNGVQYTQKASPWAVVTVRYAPTYQVVYPSPISPISGSVVRTLLPTFKWIKATDNPSGTDQLLCVSKSIYPYGKCDVLTGDVSGLSQFTLAGQTPFTSGKTYYWQICDGGPKAGSSYFWLGNECGKVFKFTTDLNLKPPVGSCPKVKCINGQPCSCN